MPVHLAAQASTMIDIGMLIAMAQADANGNLIPNYIQEGSVVFSNPKGRTQWMTLAVCGAFYNPRKATCGEYWIYCYGYSNETVSPSSFSVAVNGTVQLDAQATYADGTVYDFTSSSTWSSNDTAVATVGASTGIVTGVSAGSVIITVELPSLVVTTGEICSNGAQIPCPTANLGSGAGGTVGDGTPVINSVSPNSWISGYTYSNGSIGGKYFGTNPTVSLSDPTISFSYAPVSDGQINFSATIPTTTPSETVTITVTSQGYNGSGWVAATPGESPSTSAAASNTAPYPTNFKEAGWGKQGCCTLEFTYTWGSSTGNEADLAACEMGEYVTSQLGTGTVSWPYPFVQTATYPIISYFTSTSGLDNDELLAPNGFNTPYKAASFTDTQILRYSCPGVNGGSWVTLMGPLSIVHAVNQTNGVWQYIVTKADGSLTYNLP